MQQAAEAVLRLFREQRSLPVLLLVLFAFALYGNSLRNGYSIDDHRMIENHPQASRGIAAIPEILTTNFLYHDDVGAAFRPIPRISFAVEYQLFGANPHAGHVVNLVLYGLTAIVVMILVRSIFPRASPWLPLTVALLFLAHPIHTEVVDNLKNRDELMASLFGLLSLIGFLRYYRGGETAFLALGTASILFSLLSKESGHQFLALVPLVLFFGAGWQTRRMVVCVACVLAATLGFWFYLLTFLHQESALYMASAKGHFLFLGHPLMFVADFSTRYGTAFYSLGYYLRLLVLPHPLSFFYGYGAIPLVGLGNGWAILSAGIYLALAGFALVGLRKRSVSAFAILFFLGGLAVFSNLLVPMQGIVAERHVFAASLGFCILLGWVLTSLPAWTRHSQVGRVAAVAGLVSLLALYGVKTVDRNRDWESHLSLAENDVEAFPDAALIHAVLFKVRQERAQASEDPQRRAQEMRQALVHLSEVSRIAPSYRARVSFLSGLFQLHMLDSPRASIASFRDALAAAAEPAPLHDRALEVEKWLIHLRLAEAYARIDEAGEASDQLRQSVVAYNAEAEDPIAWERVAALPLDESILFVAGRMASR